MGENQFISFGAQQPSSWGCLMRQEEEEEEEVVVVVVVVVHVFEDTC